MIKTQKLLFFFSMLLVWTFTGKANAQSSLHYQVSFPDANAHYCNIQLTIDKPDQRLELMMPTWTPGSYLIREYARFIDSEKAVDGDNKELVWTKTSKNRWVIECGDASKVTFSYRLYCHELSVRTNWIDDELAILNGAATFVVPVDRVEQPLDVQLQLAKTWPRSVCALPELPDHPHHYMATTFHELVDSPILCGNCHIHPFEVSGIPHALVNLGDDDAWDAQKAVNDLKKIVAAQHEFWGVVPYKNYLFLNIIRGGGGGLEHDNCTMIMSNRFTCRSDQSYKSWLTLASHEFFHTWNVRRLRPQILKQYDYENEVYLRQLWIAEGITSYYENVLATRAGVLTQKDLLENLSKDITSIEASPGNNVQSLSDASFDAWIKFYRPHENSRNTTISYYSRGAVAAFILDCEIRRATNNSKSLDDVMVAMFKNHLDGGYTSQQFRDTCSAVAGADLGPWFTKFIDQPNAFEYNEDLAFLGLQFDTPKDKVQLGIGATLSDSNGKTLIRSLHPNSSARKAGLDSGDEVIAINNLRIDSKGFDAEMKELSAGDIVQLLIARRDNLKTIPVAIQTEPNVTFKIEVIKEPTDDQESHRREWLHIKPAETNETEQANESEQANATEQANESEQPAKSDPPAESGVQ